MIKLKDGINPDVLRNYGFHLGKEDFGKERWCGDGSGYGFQAEWYHKFLMYDNDIGFNGQGIGKIAYIDDEFDIPMVQISFGIGDRNEILYIDCVPSRTTYHICGEELDIIGDTIYQLALDGVIELADE